LEGYGENQVTRVFRHDPVDFRSLPPAIRLLMIANIVGFLIALVVPDMHNLFGLVPQQVLFHRWIWQPITYLFLHGNLWHLFFNLFALWMFGMPVEAQLYFMYATVLIAVPTGVKVFNWVATMWKGSLTFETPMLFAIGFLFLFTLGGFTGLVLSITPVDVQLHDTYYVVAHFHYVMVAGALFSAFAGIYFWLPKWTGKMYDETLGKWHFWLSLVFFNVTFFVQHFLGLAGMPRRIPDYAVQFTEFNMISTIGAFGFGFSQLLFLYVVVKCIRSGEKAPEKPWEGADSLEWTHLPTPAPWHSFETPPVLK
ncbi:MAG: rhomboid family intramembrane serine protease, partial [Burkholderiales bacterium]|nr:rhomboid family intramembrane serine protease [Burkholderiales bacterium]